LEERDYKDLDWGNEVDRKSVTISRAIATSLEAAKVERIADECGVKCTLVDTSLQGKGKWINDFEIEGLSGKVEGCVRRIKDLEVPG